LRLRVEPHGVRLFSIRRKHSIPSLAGLTRHVTQGGVEVVSYCATQSRLQMKFLPSRGPVTAFIHTAGKQVASLHIPPASKKRLNGKILRLSLPPGGPHTVDVRFAF
jgi:hypothetical protein